MPEAVSAAVYLLSLGCDKNRVDSEIMLGLLRGAGYTLMAEPEDAEAIIVNTCGFIRDAAQEAVNQILTMAAHKQTGRCRALVVTGCAAQRYKEDILAELPEVDAVIGVNDFHRIVTVLADVMNGQRQIIHTGSEPPAKDWSDRRLITAPMHTAHVKIAEGCDNRCAYCAIPAIRGRYRSRTFESILDECRRLMAEGVKELVLVAQDTTRYGVDLYGVPRLHDLLRAIAGLDGLVWVRVLYVYPENITSEIIDAIAECPVICHYIDMPIQHSHDDVLRRMGRRSTQAGLKETITTLRARIPDIIIRTTLMVGFPGETDEEFEALRRFVEEIRFDRLGVFAYSREDGTPAARMKNQVKASVKKSRRDTLMRLQQTISAEKQQALIGQTIMVMTDAQITSRARGAYRYGGRSYRDTFELDGMVYFTATQNLMSGDRVEVTITDAGEYDVYGYAR